MALAEGNISNYSKHFKSRQVQWEKVRHAIEGEDQIKQMGRAYLPKPSGMTPTEYNNYKERAMFYGVAERTLRGLTGMIFRKDPVLELPTKMQPLITQFTSDGHSLMMFLDELVREILSLGRYGLLPDFKKDAGPTDLPYIVTYKAEDITMWEQRLIDGQKVLTRVVLRDEIETSLDSGNEQFLELYLDDAGVYTVSRYEYDARTNLRISRGEPTQPTVQGKTLNYIPFIFVNAYNLRPEVEKPPFLDLVNMNIAHYRNSADYEHALYMTAQPTPWVAGVVSEESKPKTIGPTTIWYITEQGRAGLLEFTGKGIGAQRDAMKDKEDRMAALGARMIAENANRNETVDTARLRGRGEMSLLMSVVNTLDNAVLKLLTLIATWMGITEEIKFKLNRDFVETRMTDKEITALVAAWQNGAISRTTLHENLQRGEIVGQERTTEQEEEEIESDDLRIPPVAPGAGPEPEDTEPEES
jgi:hypothetical protein